MFLHRGLELIFGGFAVEEFDEVQVCAGELSTVLCGVLRRDEVRDFVNDRPLGSGPPWERYPDSVSIPNNHCFAQSGTVGNLCFNIAGDHRACDRIFVLNMSIVQHFPEIIL